MSIFAGKLKGGATMKGLKEYIEKHGKHLTLDLVEDVVPLKWGIEDISKDLHKAVWYNVTESTTGDILYLINSSHDKTRRECISQALNIVGDVFCEGSAFFRWYISTYSDVDLRKYI